MCVLSEMSAAAAFWNHVGPAEVKAHNTQLCHSEGSPWRAVPSSLVAGQHLSEVQLHLAHVVQFAQSKI